MEPRLPKFMQPQGPAPAAPRAPAAVQDPLLPMQYAMTITGAVAAWQLVAGNPDVRIAVLDEDELLRFFHRKCFQQHSIQEREDG